MKTLVLDGYNLMHRARSGFTRGDSFVIYNFFRSLRPLVEKFDPDKIFFVLEGSPKKRIALDENYKANRKVDKSDPKYEKLVDFHRQKKIIIRMMELFPVTIVKHPDYECDDVIANICYDINKQNNANNKVTIVSSDSDFYQLLDLPEVELYNPVKKKFIEKPEYDYVMWKALRGDATDNIPGIPGVGDKTADKLIKNPEALQAFMQKDENNRIIWHRNIDLIKLHEFGPEDLLKVEAVEGSFSPMKLKSLFAGHGFNSMIKDKSWIKFCETFNHADCIKNSSEVA